MLNVLVATPQILCTTMYLLVQDLSCLDYAALVASYNGSSAAAANCTGNLKRLVVAQHQYAVPYGPTLLVMNDPAFIGGQTCRDMRTLRLHSCAAMHPCNCLALATSTDVRSVCCSLPLSHSSSAGEAASDHASPSLLQKVPVQGQLGQV